MLPPDNSNYLTDRLLELVDDVIWAGTPDGQTLLYANPALERVYGRAAAEFSDNPSLWLDMVHPDDRTAAEQSAAELLAIGHAEVTYRIIRPDGAVRWLLDRKHVIYDDAGQPQCIGGITSDITAHKQADVVLETSERKFRGIAEQSPDAIVLTDGTGRVIEWNPAAERIYGLPKDRAVGRPLWEIQFELAMPEYRTRERLDFLQSTITHTLETGHGPLLNRLVDVPIQRSDGKQVVIQTIAFAINAEPGYWLGSVSRDVTAQKQVERALKASEDRYHQTFETNQAVKLIINPADGRIVDANDAACRFYGYDRPTLTSLRITDINTLSEQEVQQEMVRAGSVESLFFNFRHRLAGGEIRDVEVYSGPIQIEGQPLLYSIVHDVTDRKRAEQEVKTQRRRLTAILEGTNVGTWEWYVQTGETIFNERWANIIGYALAEISPTTIETWHYFAHPDDLPRSGELLRRHFAGELPYYEYEARMRHKDGRWVWVLDRGKVAARNEDGQPLLMSGTHQDITERKLLEESLRQAKEAAETANRAKSAFLSSMSHELRTPLNGILGYTQIFKQDSSLTPQQQEGIDIIQRSGEHLLVMINDILDLSKIEAGRMELHPANIDLPRFLKTIVEMVRVWAGQKGLELRFLPGPNLPARVAADETRLRQVLLNLLGNAVKFTEQGSVTLRVLPVTDTGPYVESGQISGDAAKITLRFEVTDTGSGIPPERRAEIFEPFRQVGEGPHKAGGTGLGLAISYKLVWLLGGELQVENAGNSWEAGSRFWFELPVRRISPAVSGHRLFDASQPVTGYRRTQGSGLFTLLLADDSIDNRSVLSHLLSRLGFEVVEAADGAEAVARALEQVPDLILMDLVMPDTDGLTAVRQIRQNPQLQQIPVVAVSASVDNDTRHLSRVVGCNDFLTKPFATGDLLAAIQRQLPLNWVYDEPVYLPASEGQLVTPPADELRQLLSSATIGDVTAIETQVKRLPPQYATFATRIIELTSEFELDTLEQFIRQQLEEK
ncbi:MAG: hypothetical protein Kow0031_23130 [Anaerolineae bacterium]